MLTTWVKAPCNAFYLARRTASLSLMLTGEVAAAVFPSLLMPRDLRAWNAWEAGYLEPPSAGRSFVSSASIR